MWKYSIPRAVNSFHQGGLQQSIKSMMGGGGGGGGALRQSLLGRFCRLPSIDRAVICHLQSIEVPVIALFLVTEDYHSGKVLIWF